MSLIWVLGVVALALVLFFAGARTVGGGNRVRTNQDRGDGQHGRDMGANVNPSQQGNAVDLWPDRTGARTRRELGARSPVDLSFTGGVEEQVGGAGAMVSHDRAMGGPAESLAPEDASGEDRPANRTTPIDQPPTQWHPQDHGAPGDHIVDGHHRSASAPERQSNATDPYAHAPVPGPNHIPSADGVSLPDDIRP